MRESDVSAPVLEYAAPTTHSSRAEASRSGAHSRMISSSIIFVGAVILAVSRRDAVVIGVALGIASLAMFMIEYVRSWRSGRG